MATRIPQILSVPSGLDAQLTKFLQSVKETVEIREGRRGIDGDRFVRRADLGDLGMLVNAGLTYTALTEHCTDPIDPPTNFVVVKGHWCNYLSWDNPTDEMFAGVEVWCHSANARGDATLIAIVTNPGQTYVHYMSDFTNPHYYWIRARSFNQDVYSMWLPRGLTGGEVISGDTTIGETVEKMIDILKGTDPDTYGAATTYYKDDLVQYADSSGNLRRYKCIDDDSGTGISGTVPTNTDYWEHIGILMVGNIDGVATVGIDGNLVVDGTLLARHIAADQIDTSHMNVLNAFIGLTIQSTSFETGVSGWQINKDGDVEFNSGTFRGATDWSAITGDDKPADGADVTPTTRLFTDATTRANIEAWRRAGSPTYLDGSHIYSQSIVADKINTSTLSAITADLGTVTAGIAKSSDGNLYIGFDDKFIKVFSDTVTISSGVNNKLDWEENSAVKVATLTGGTYTPTTLAAHLQTIMRAAADADTTVVYNSTTKKITIANSTLTTLKLLWSSGTNTSTTCGKVVGFAVSLDDTGAKTYTADNQCALRVQLGYIA